MSAVSLLLASQEVKGKKAAKNLRWIDKKLLLVADSVEAVDGAVIAGSR